MFWDGLFSIGTKLTRPVRTGIRLHMPLTFRVLLFGGDVLILMVLLYIQQNVSYRHAYDLWLAGLAATLGILFLFAMGSACVHGYHPYKDRWVGLASTLMFALCLVSVIGSI